MEPGRIEKHIMIQTYWNCIEFMNSASLNERAQLRNLNETVSIELDDYSAEFDYNLVVIVSVVLV